MKNNITDLLDEFKKYLTEGNEQKKGLTAASASCYCTYIKNGIRSYKEKNELQTSNEVTNEDAETDNLKKVSEWIVSEINSCKEALPNIKEQDELKKQYKKLKDLSNSHSAFIRLMEILPKGGNVNESNSDSYESSNTLSPNTTTNNEPIGTPHQNNESPSSYSVTLVKCSRDAFKNYLTNIYRDKDGKTLDYTTINLYVSTLSKFSKANVYDCWWELDVINSAYDLIEDKASYDRNECNLRDALQYFKKLIEQSVCGNAAPGVIVRKLNI